MTTREHWRVVSIKDVCEAIVDCVNKTELLTDMDTLTIVKMLAVGTTC